MGLQAKIHTNFDGNITVRMTGGIDYETSIPFREEILTLMKGNPSSYITLDMDQVDFVGSSGIGLFVETLRILNDKKEQIKLANVKTEFIKVFQLYKLDSLETLIHEFDNDQTENLNSVFGNRTRTFEQ